VGLSLHRSGVAGRETKTCVKWDEMVSKSGSLIWHAER
jgi:hypothetical protein